MKFFLPAFLVLAVLATLFMSGCAYDGGGSGFTQQDLELQRKNADRARGM